MRSTPACIPLLHGQPQSPQLNPSGVGVTKSPSLAPISSPVVLKYQNISHSYLTGVTTAVLWWHMSNMNVILGIAKVLFFKIKNLPTTEIKEQSFSTPTGPPQIYHSQPADLSTPVPSQPSRPQDPQEACSPLLSAGCFVPPSPPHWIWPVAALLHDLKQTNMTISNLVSSHTVFAMKDKSATTR